MRESRVPALGGGLGAQAPAILTPAVPLPHSLDPHAQPPPCPSVRRHPGAFRLRRGNGGAGRCSVDLVAEPVPGSQALKTTGTFCGFPVDATFRPTR